MKLSHGDLLYHNTTSDIGMVIKVKQLQKFSANDPQYVYTVQWSSGQTASYFSNSNSLRTYRYAYNRLRKELTNATKI